LSWCSRDRNHSDTIAGVGGVFYSKVNTDIVNTLPRIPGRRQLGGTCYVMVRANRFHVTGSGLTVVNLVTLAHDQLIKEYKPNREIVRVYAASSVFDDLFMEFYKSFKVTLS
jgi:hypothetical protein